MTSATADPVDPACERFAAWIAAGLLVFHAIPVRLDQQDRGSLGKQAAASDPGIARKHHLGRWKQPRGAAALVVVF